MRTGVIVNKADLNSDMADKIRAAAEQAGADLLGAIPYEQAFTQAQIERQTLLEHSDCEAARLVASIWAKIIEHLSGGDAG